MCSCVYVFRDLIKLSVDFVFQQHNYMRLYDACVFSLFCESFVGDLCKFN